MRGLGLPMERDEIPLDVPVDAALTHLVRSSLDERVVTLSACRHLNGHGDFGFADDATYVRTRGETDRCVQARKNASADSSASAGLSDVDRMSHSYSPCLTASGNTSFIIHAFEFLVDRAGPIAIAH